MSNRILLAAAHLAVIVCCGLTGCSMCCGPYDFHYPAFGGKHQRVDPTHGRVGSIFSDPNVVLGPSSDSNLEPHPVAETPRIPADDDLDMEDLDSDDDDLKPLDRLDEDVEELPDPDSEADSEVTASRLWRQRALRQNSEYR